MTAADYKDWLSVVALLISIGGIAWGWLNSGSTKALKEQADRITEMGKTVAGLRTALDERCAAIENDGRLVGDATSARFQLSETRMVKLEEAVRHLPDREQSHRLELAVTTLSGKIETLEEKLRPVSAIADRLQEFLLEQARR